MDEDDSGVCATWVSLSQVATDVPHAMGGVADHMLTRP